MADAYVDVATAKRHEVLSRVNTTQLTDLLKAASDWIDHYTDRVDDIAAPVRPWSTSEQTEVYDGSGGPTLYLRRVPVSAISAIVVTDGNGDDETLTSTDYNFNKANGAVRFGPDNSSNYGVWPDSFQQNVSVTYTAGYTTVPDWLEQATIYVALQMHKKSAANANAAFKSESLGDHSFTRVDGGEPIANDFIKGLLEDHRRLEV